MNRRRADAVVGVLVLVILVVGGALAWQAARRRQAFSSMMGGGMMDGSTGMVYGTDPLWYVLGTLLAAGLVGGLYLAARDDLTGPGGVGRTSAADSTDRDGAAAPSPDATPADGGQASRDHARVLDLLPEDERRVLEPVLDSPGVTQIELRDRSDFSKSKVSQTVSALEKRGLLYRERQGRTYRVYPSDDLQ